MNCADCLYGRKPEETQFSRECHRNPMKLPKAPGDWCGEWCRLETKQPVVKDAYTPYFGPPKPTLSLPKRK